MQWKKTEYRLILLTTMTVMVLVGCKPRESNTKGKGQSESSARSNPVIKPSVALQDKHGKPHGEHSPRLRKHGTALCNAYYKSYDSIQDREKFISQYPDERDLCAGALLRIAQLYEKQGQRERAIETYQKAIDEYGEEIVPYVCAIFRVKDWALLHIGLLYKDIGQRNKAMEIFSNLTDEGLDDNTKGAARMHYLETKQSHLKIKVKVSVPRNRWTRTYAVGDQVPVSVVIKNNTKETVAFVPYAKMCTKRMRNCRFAPRTGSNETTLLPGEKCERAYIFTHKDTKGLEPGKYKVVGELTGIPFTTNSVTVKIVEKPDSI